jgi:endo-1,4-beta-D-glucanase Y
MAAAAVTLTGCGGGGGGGADSASAAADAAPTPIPAPTPAPLASGQTVAPAAAPAAVPAQPAVVAGTRYPFGARIDAYVAGIKPSISAGTMDALLTSHYDAWKAARVVRADSVVAGGYAIQFSDTNYLTVSEGMGYGMLLTVLMAGHDPDAQNVFNGLLATVRARPAYSMGTTKLMDWRVAASGASDGGGWNAMDGDLDIAMALLMADRQWGSSGAINYLAEGKATIADLKAYNMTPDGFTKGLRSAANNRTSDYMITHFRAFKRATGDSLWDAAVDKAYYLLNLMQTTYAPGTGLMPDFIMNTASANPEPSTGYIGDGNAMEGFFYWNGCRNPWRLGSDYVTSGDARFATICGRLLDFLKSASGGDASKIASGYKLDGTVLGPYPDSSFIGPAAVGAMVDARFQGFLDACWQWNASNLTTGYYDSELQLLSMVVASGNWWNP